MRHLTTRHTGTHGDRSIIIINAVFEPTKAQNLFVISLFSGLSGIGVVLCVVTGGDENEKDDR